MLSSALKSAPLRIEATVERLVKSFLAHGVVEFGQILDPVACERLLAQVRASRRFGPELFLDEASFDANPRYKGVNPEPGRNLLEALGPASDFVEEHEAIAGVLANLLGERYVVLDKKLVCGVPETWLPEWLVRRIKGNPVNNLGPYVRPEYRDITYFYGIDYHQDIIDWKDRNSDFVTVYIYIHPVTQADAPLHVLLDSHLLGATVFPHALARDAATGRWCYEDRRGGAIECPERMLVGGTGYAALWHSAILHGTQPDKADRERLSLRYLIARAPGAEHAAIDQLNTTIKGPLSLGETRRDLDAKGAARLRQNTITGVMDTAAE